MALIVICALLPLVPIVARFTASGAPEGDTARYLVRFFPFFALTAAGCAYLAYPERPVLSWILIVLLLMSYGAVLAL